MTDQRDTTRSAEANDTTIDSGTSGNEATGARSGGLSRRAVLRRGAAATALGIAGVGASATAPAGAATSDSLVWEDFEDPDYDSHFTSTWAESEWGDSLVTSPVYAGSSALRVTLHEGDHKGIHGTYDPEDAGDLGSNTQELYASYWVRFESEFEASTNLHKLPGPKNTEDGCGKGGCVPDGRDWSARGTFTDASASGSTIDVGYYVYHLDMSGSYGDGFGITSITKGEWHHVEQHVALNTVDSGGNANADGVLEMWIDGTKTCDQQDMRFTEQPEHGINYNWGVYYGGNDTSPKTQSVYFDNWGVDESEMPGSSSGCGSGYDTHLFEIVTDANTTDFDYSFDVDGTIEKNLTNGDNSAEESNDSITDNGDGTYTVSGHTGDGEGDSYCYSGTLSNWSADHPQSAFSLYLDGREVSADCLATESLLEVVADSSTTSLDYSFDVDGTIKKNLFNGANSAEDSNDSITDDGDGTYSVSGHTGDGQGDSYCYAGSIDNWSADHEASEYTVYVDGTPVSVSELDDETFEIHQFTFDDAWQTRGLDGSYNSPVVLAKPISYGGNQPAHTRLRNVSGGSFEASVEEWDYLDGSHVTETVSSLVTEAGTETADRGTPLEAGTVPVSGEEAWSSMSFSQSFSTAPVVVSQPQTYDGAEAIITRNRSVSTGGFETTIQEQENHTYHPAEDVGYLAVEPGTGYLDGAAFEAGTVTGVTDAWTTISFSRSYADPGFLADQQTFNGNNTAGLRYRNLSSDSVEVFVEEERSADDETDHFHGETVGYVVVEDG